MSHTSTGETDETRMQVCQGLSQVGTQSIFTSFERILREEGNHVKMISTTGGAPPYISSNS